MNYNDSKCSSNSTTKPNAIGIDKSTGVVDLCNAYDDCNDCDNRSECDVYINDDYNGIKLSAKSNTKTKAKKISQVWMNDYINLQQIKSP